VGLVVGAVIGAAMGGIMGWIGGKELAGDIEKFKKLSISKQLAVASGTIGVDTEDKSQGLRKLGFDVLIWQPLRKWVTTQGPKLMASGAADIGKGYGVAVKAGLELGVKDLSHFVGEGAKMAVTSGFRKGGLKVLGGVAKTTLGKFFKYIPGVSAIIGAAEAIDFLNRGKPDQALIALGSGIAGVFPGIGTAISLLLDLANVGMSMRSAKDSARGLFGLNETFNGSLGVKGTDTVKGKLIEAEAEWRRQGESKERIAWLKEQKRKELELDAKFEARQKKVEARTKEFIKTASSTETVKTADDNVNDWMGKAKLIIAKDGKRIKPHRDDWVTAQKEETRPLSMFENNSTNKIDKAIEKMNNGLQSGLDKISKTLCDTLNINKDTSSVFYQILDVNGQQLKLLPALAQGSNEKATSSGVPSSEMRDIIYDYRNERRFSLSRGMI